MQRKLSLQNSGHHAYGVVDLQTCIGPNDAITQQHFHCVHFRIWLVGDAVPGKLLLTHVCNSTSNLNRFRAIRRMISETKRPPGNWAAFSSREN